MAATRQLEDTGSNHQFPAFATESQIFCLDSRLFNLFLFFYQATLLETTHCLMRFAAWQNSLFGEEGRGNSGDLRLMSGHPPDLPQIRMSVWSSANRDRLGATT